MHCNSEKTGEFYNWRKWNNNAHFLIEFPQDWRKKSRAGVAKVVSFVSNGTFDINSLTWTVWHKKWCRKKEQNKRKETGAGLPDLSTKLICHYFNKIQLIFNIRNEKLKYDQVFSISRSILFPFVLQSIAGHDQYCVSYFWFSVVFGCCIETDYSKVFLWEQVFLNKVYQTKSTYSCICV